MTGLKEKEIGQEVIVKLVVVNPKVLDLLANCLIAFLFNDRREVVGC